MTKLRLGYYTDAITNASVLGGAEVYLRELVQNIDYDKYELFLFCKEDYNVKQIFCNEKISFNIVRVDTQDRDGAIAKKKLKNSAFFNLLRTSWRKFPSSSLKYLIGNFNEARYLASFFKKYKLDLLHSNNDGGFEPAVIAAYLAKIPVIIATYHVHPPQIGDRKSDNLVRRILEHIMARCLTRAISPSKNVSGMWEKRLNIGQNKFKTIYNGINLNKFSNQPDIEELKQKLGIENDTPIVGIAARLHPMKGHIYLIRAIPNILSKIPNAKFVLVGEGELRHELEELIKESGLENSVKFLGYRSDIDRLMHIFDIAVLPSIAFEALPYTLIEAMACRKPVVASNFSGIPEVVEDGVTGILVPPKDPNKLADAIIKLIQDENLRKKMGEAGRQRVEKCFTRDAMLRKTFDLYQELLIKANRFFNKKI